MELPQGLSIGRGGLAHMKRAMRTVPDADSWPEALVAQAEAATGVLSPSTVGVYVHEHARVLESLVLAGIVDGRSAMTALTRIAAAIGAREDTEIAPRTSALKAKVLSADELERLFRATKSKALGEGNREVALVGLMIVALVLTGARPVELTTAEKDGNILRMMTAKRGAATPRYRHFRIRGIPPIWIDAILVAADAYGTADLDSFYRHHRALAQILGRVSLKVLGRRIAFYTLRHVTAASWRMAGVSEEEIMTLMGHIRPETQAIYGRGSGGAGVEVLRSISADAVPAGLFATQRSSDLIGEPRGKRMTFAERLALDDTGEIADGAATVAVGPVETTDARTKQSRDPHAPAAAKPQTGSRPSIWPTPTWHTNRRENNAPAPLKGPVSQPSVTPTVDPPQPLQAPNTRSPQRWRDRTRRGGSKQEQRRATVAEPEDPFDHTDMPVPDPVRPLSADHSGDWQPPKADPELEAILLELAEGKESDLSRNPDWAMPKPDSGLLPDELQRGPTDDSQANAGAEIDSEADSVPAPSPPLQPRRTGQ